VSKFERFVGIDWSGAQTAVGGIQVAEFHRNERRPKIISPSKVHWRRSEILDYIKSLESRTIVGIDFAFSVPWPDNEAPWPRNNIRLMDVHQLWASVDSLCANEVDLFAGPVWLSQQSPFRPLIRHHRTGHVGELYERNRLRKTEKIASRRPISIYHMTGAQVGQGSFAGMRLLHALCGVDDAAAIWPFHPVDSAKVTIVEVYPSLFYFQAGRRRPRKRDVDVVFFENIKQTLAHFSIQDGYQECGRSVDKADAIVTAAALSSIVNHSQAFTVPGSCLSVASREGWIFGVPLKSDH
jgi:hypothetical protein